MCWGPKEHLWLLGQGSGQKLHMVSPAWTKALSPVLREECKTKETAQGKAETPPPAGVRSFGLLFVSLCPSRPFLGSGSSHSNSERLLHRIVLPPAIEELKATKQELFCGHRSILSFCLRAIVWDAQRSV